MPWLKDDIHARFKTMTPQEIGQVDGFPQPGTFSRFNGSPYYITKIPDLIGIKDRRTSITPGLTSTAARGHRSLCDPG